MKITSKISALILIMLTFSFFNAQEQQVAENVTHYIPQDEFYKSRKIDALEKENIFLSSLIEDWLNVEKKIVEIKSVLSNSDNTNKKKIEAIKKIFPPYDPFGSYSANFSDSQEGKKYINYCKDLGDNIHGHIDLILLTRTPGNNPIPEESEDEIKEKIQKLKDFIDKNPINAIITDLKGKVKNNENYIKAIEAKEDSIKINTLAIRWGIPAFCITILLLYILPVYFQSKNNQNNDSDNKNNILDVSTVLLLTMTILILGLSSSINSEVLGTLLGGISAYVLNRNLNRKSLDNSAGINNNPTN